MWEEAGEEGGVVVGDMHYIVDVFPEQLQCRLSWSGGYLSSLRSDIFRFVVVVVVVVVKKEVHVHVHVVEPCFEGNKQGSTKRPALATSLNPKTLVQQNGQPLVGPPLQEVCTLREEDADSNHKLVDKEVDNGWVKISQGDM